MPKPLPAGHRRCKDCKRVLPLSAFYEIKKPGYRVTGCFECAKSNMAAWAKGRVGMKGLHKNALAGAREDDA